MKKRILAAFLAAILICNPVPQTAYAQELPNDESIVEILENGSGVEEEVAVSEEAVIVSEEVIASEEDDTVSEEVVIVSEEENTASDEDDIVLEEILDSEDAIGLYAMDSAETQASPYLYDVNEEKQAIIKQYNGTDSHVVIPEQIDGFEVVRIADMAFFDNDIVEQIEVPKTVTSLGERVFAWCSNLQKVTFAGNIEVLSDYTFDGCVKLTEVILPEGLKEIGKCAFYECYRLGNIQIPDGVIYIGNSAFEFAYLKSIQLPEELTYLGYSAFGYSGSKDSITLPRKLARMEDWAFECADPDEVFVLNPELDIKGLKVDEDWWHPTIYAAEGSKAQEYAIAHKIPFVVWEEPVTEVSFDYTDVTMKYGESYRLIPNVVPSSFTQRLIWASSDPTVVSVDEKGNVKAAGYGTAVVSVTVGELTASCNVTVDGAGGVVPIPVQYITLGRSKWKVPLDNQSRKVGVHSVFPANATMHEVIWSSSDETVVRCASDGTFATVKAGTAVLTAEAKDGQGAKASCVITVSNGTYICTSVEELESGHYEYFTLEETWIYTVPGAKKLEVTFDKRTEEGKNDWIDDPDEAPNWLSVANMTGNSHLRAGETIEVTGDTFKISYKHDGSAWGFKVTSIAAYGLPLTGTVTIEGDSYYGSTLKAVVTDTSNSGTLQYQWLRDEEAIVGATDDTYELQKEDAEHTITCVVTSDREDGELRCQCYIFKQPELTVKQVGQRVFLSWDSVEYTQQYLVYRQQEDGAYQMIATLDSSVLEYEDQTAVLGETYSYKVEVYADKTGSVSEPVTIQTNPAPGEVSILVSYANEKGIHISWNIVDGAAGYRIYRKDDNGEWQPVENLTNKYNRYFYDPNVEAGKKYVYGVSAYVFVTDGKEFSGELTEVTVTTPPLQTELRLTATVDGIELSWEKIPAADGYIILRDATGSGRYTEIEMIADSNVTSYVDADVVGGRRYRYAIYTYLEDKESAWSKNEIVAALQIPVVTLTAMDTGIKVSWKEILGAEGYYVYRKEVGGKYQKIATVTGKRYFLDKTAEGGKEYYYTVKAYAGETVSGYVSAKIKIALPVPQTVVKATAGGVKVTWNAASGVEGYRIYRKEADGAFVKIATVKAGEDTAYLDTTAEGGVKYDYAVKSYWGTSSSGYVSVSVEAMLISPVTKLTLLDTGVKVSWTEVAGATEYYVYRKVTGGAYAKIATVAGKNYFKDTKAIAGREYYYAVKAAKGTLVSGYKSDLITVPLVTPTTKVTLTNTGAKVSWNLIFGAEEYYVYRKPVGGSYEQIATISGKNYYLDKKATPGKQYYYTVKSVAGGKISGYKSVLVTVPNK